MIKNYTDKDYADKAVEANSKGLSLYILVTPTEFTGEDEQGQPIKYTEDVATLVLAETGYYITYNGNYTDGTINENLEQEKAKKMRNYLIEQVNYPLKAQVAYTGVRFDYEGQELVFETNETSISMVNFTAMMAQQAQLTEISNWKCRKTIEPYEPVSVTFTMEQFQKLLTFASTMVLGAFAVEEQINLQIQALSDDELNNPLYIEEVKRQMQEAYSKVPVKIEGLFNTEIEGDV